MTAEPQPASAPPEPAPLDISRLFEAHAPWVHRVAQRLTGSAAAADDVVQEVFLTAHRRRDAVADRLGIRTWLYRTTVNVARQKRRTDQRYGNVIDRFGRQPSAPGATPEAEVSSAAHGLAVRACIQALSETQREVFVLFELEGVDGGEIAEILDIPINTVWSRLRLARVAFREIWLHRQGDTP